MNIKEFSDQKPGQLTHVTTPWGPDHAFLPNPLPPSWEFPASLWPLLADVKGAVGILEGIGRGLSNPTLLLKPLTNSEAIQSSALEGTYATPQELLFYELGLSQGSPDEERTHARREVDNYRRALEYGTSAEKILSLRLLREMHELLMRDVRGSEKTPGQFRQQQVAIGANGRFIPPPPISLRDYLDELETYFLEPSEKYDPIVNCYLIHYQFETIHPFNDGNGRVGRLLLAIMLQKACKLTKPWLYMSPFFNKHRDDYIQKLYDISSKSDWNSWIEFCLVGTLEQALDTIRRCERIEEIRTDYMQRLRENSGAARLVQIVDHLFERQYLKVSDIKELLNVTDPTARSDAQRLVELGILAELPNVWPKTYAAPEVFLIAYE